MLRPTKSSTVIPGWEAYRQPAIPARFARRGSRCAKPVRPREPCSSPRRQSAGMWMQRPAARKVVKCCTRRRGNAPHMASLPPTPPACLSPKTWRSSGRRISSSSARRPSVWTQQGRSTARPSMASTFGPPGVKIATLAQSPVFGGRVKRVDDAAAKAVKGVRQIVHLDDAVAVVADHMGAAKKGLAALVIEWDDGPHAKLNTDVVAAELEKATLSAGAVAQNVGDVDKAMTSAVTRVEATYQLPFLAHATMEPMNCTVHVRKDDCEIWLGSQAIARVQAAAAKTTGLPLDKIVVHNHLIGGGFGRRLEADGAIRAVQIAQHVDGPVKVVWTREEDVQHDMYRPYFLDRLSAGLDDKGMPVAWRNRFAGSSILARFLPPAFNGGLDPDTTDGAINLVYALPNFHVEYVRVEPPGIPTAFWRSVGPSHNVFVTESFVDELAAAAKQDPVAYRRALLGKSPRAKAVLDLAAEKASWGQPLPDRAGRGIALQFAFGSYMAHVAEVEVASSGAVRVRRLVCALDTGTVVNPDTVQAQVEGGMLFGVTAVLHGEITLKNGRVEQENFDSYLPLRIDEAPAIEVHVVPSRETPGGMGEAGTSLVPAAVTNAIFAATGTRLRKLPVDAAALRRA